MNAKPLLASLAGGIALFFMGYIFYVLLFADFFTSSADREEFGFLYIILGEVVWGALLAWVFSRAGITELADGVKSGAIIGFLAGLAHGLIMYGATTVADLSYYLADAVVFAVRYGVAGAAVAAVLGRGTATNVE